MYSFTLEKFEGPLDLLLHLIDKSKIDIKDIFVSEITSQYIDYINNNDIGMDDISEFLSMAATLLYIKSKKLVPVVQVEEDEEDLEQKLIMELEDYKKFKMVSQELKEKIKLAPQIFTKYKDEYPFDPQVYDIGDVSLDMLINAYKKLLENMQLEDQLPQDTSNKVMRQDKYTIKQKISIIKKLLVVKKQVEFTDLFDTCDKGDMIVTFLSLLELLHLNEIHLHQPTPFTDILITLKDVD